MEAHHHHQKKKENNVDKEISERAQLKQEKEEQALPKSPSSSSPSHEFSFTNSLHSSSTTIHANSKASLPSLALDLSPADDIFFHGHLLPLHLLSHLPSSPRFSTNSFHSLLEDENHNKDNGCSSSNRNNITIDNIDNNSSNSNSNNNNIGKCNIIRTKEESKSKPTFSLFGLVRGHKGCQVRDKEDKEKQKKKLGFEVIHALKRYLQIVQPLVLFRGRREKVGLQKQSYSSHSGNLIRRNKPELIGRRGGYSAPASMRTSQTNSSLLLATTTLPSDNDSTMEELQSAIQAAIAHCKNSVAREHKC
ncbi:hypothetical protein TanjilG_03809 [Lupinus angustifolius]|uniref:BRI1 kinase inhibitor 1 n=1 Tax=Lupinus angustifolius TaxID=3871 RepID=A0A1J7FP65_LUPAN|nr:PREDICTED: BRI1 kinase inhibitor 1-like [Lupinus angustifolius]XP_019437977.1 PREDICTED: BRI1 kinase inhibitor 1-like [Lupinus angustifolius]OIV89711.1 hypothetical protein TanjilG_03809 [Lupinus angustifolius]